MTRAFSLETIRSPQELERLFISVSISTPNTAKCSMTRRRIKLEFSPIPPVNIIPSRRRNEAACPAIWRAIRWTKVLIASCARSWPSCQAFSRTRKSEERPEIPNNPDSLFTTRSRSPRLWLVWLATQDIAPKSTSPLRVPIIKPSSGVIPIEVSTLWPLRTAQIDAPLPRCATTRPESSSARFSRECARWET